MLKVKSNLSNFDFVNTLISIVCNKLLNMFLKIFEYITSSFCSLLKVFASFIIFYYLWLPVLFVPCYLLFLYRITLSIIFKLVFRGKYKLMEAADAAHTFDSYANVNTITFFLYINGPCYLSELQKRVEKLFRQYSDQSGEQPYWKLLHVPRQKLGFLCWENLSSSFNVEHHVRYFPGFDQRNQVYRENDLFEAVSELSCREWECTRPKWEFLVTPQLKTETENTVYSVITVRISHEYGDGISIMQMFRKNIFDNPAPKLLFDPVNPPIPKISFYFKLFMYLQAFILGPWCIINFLSYKDKSIVPRKELLTGPKYLGRNKKEILLEDIRKIRKDFCVSTSAVFHSAFCGALRTMAEKRGYQIPSKLVGGMAYGQFPYPNDHLQNHFTPLVDKYPLGIEDPVERVKQIEKRLNAVVQPYSLLATSLVYTSMGVLPARVIKAALGKVNISFVVSNVPGIVGDVKICGSLVKYIYGSPPSCKGIKYTIGVGCHEGKFLLGFFLDKSAMVQSRQDLEEFIGAFEHEIQVLKIKM